jgi:hypothetical protein
MAEHNHNEVAYTTAEGNDYAAHEQTYEGFIMLVKYGTAAVILIVAMMGLFLTLSPASWAGARVAFKKSNVSAYKPVSIRAG